MTLYVYARTALFCEEAVRFGLTVQLEHLAKKIEHDQSYAGFDCFPGNFRKRRFENNLRLIALPKPYGEDTLLCLLRLLPRGGKEYERFLREPATITAKIKELLPGDDTLGAYLAKRKETPPVPLPPLGEAEIAWLHHNLEPIDLQRDEVVLETERWVEAVTRAEAKTCLSSLAEFVLKEVIDAHATEQLLTHPSQTFSLLCRRFPHHRRIFLLDFARGAGAREALLERHEQHRVLLSPEAEDLSPTTLDRHALRAYPSYFCADQEAWQNLEQDRESNLALSPEELEVLTSVRLSAHHGKRFPLFINGGAGSGKSTTMLYLFAELASFWLNEHENLPGLAMPLYLTYSPSLLQRARELLEGLLMHNAHVSTASENAASTSGVRALLERSTFVLDHYLRGLIPVNERHRYHPEQRIGFSRFRCLWKHGPGKSSAFKGLNPDLCWHVIRTFIKGSVGSSPEDFLDPDEYLCLSQEQRTVSETTYLKVYEQVFIKWYRELCVREGLWDDQDLVRKILVLADEERLELGSAPAVFCDEAQDFTAVELDLLLRLSIFSRFDVPTVEYRNQPFVFAGDPFQTLNPTGFRWEQMKALFHATCSQAMHKPGSKDNFEVNYRPLQYNYRSTHHLVGLANLVQLARAAVLQVSDLRPQGTWRKKDEQPALPVYCPLEHPGLAARLTGQRDLQFIVPCEEGEETSYLVQDPLLRSMVQLDAESNPQNVWSPMRAKGLEFKRVVLYGFGRYARAHCLAQEPDREAMEQNREMALPYEYFYNKLYVGISRAQRALFVLDDSAELAQDGFWNFALAEEGAKDLLERSRKGVRETFLPGEDSDGVPLAYLHPVQDLDWDKDRGDLREIAEYLLRHGLSKRDPALLRSAAIYFRDLALPREQRLAEAEALELEDRHLEAGERFLSVGETARALAAFWRVAAFDACLDLAAKVPEWSHDRRLAGATFMQRPTPQEASRLLERLLIEHETHPEAGADLLDRTWRQVLDKVVNDTRRASWHVKPEEEHRLLDALLRLNRVVQLDLVGLGHLAFRLNRHAEAVQCWEGTGTPTFVEYFSAKFFLLPFPSRLEWGVKAQRYQEVADLWLQEGHTLAEEEREPSLRLVEHCYTELDKFEQAVDTVLELKDYTLLEDHFVHTYSRRPETLDLGLRCAQTLLAQRIVEGSWNEALLLAVGSETPHGPRHKELLDAVANLGRERKQELAVTLVKALARSEDFWRHDRRLAQESENPETANRPFEQFINRSLIDPADLFERVSVLEGGTALERLGNFRNTCGFYERWFGGATVSADKKQYARERWLKAKHLWQLWKLEKAGVSTFEHDRAMRELENFRRTWNLPAADELSELPDPDRPLSEQLHGEPPKDAEVPPVGQPSPALSGTKAVRDLVRTPERVEWRTEHHRYLFDPAGRRFKMIALGGFEESVVIDLPLLTARGDTTLSERDRNETSASYRLEGWGLLLRLYLQKNGKVRIVLSDDAGQTLIVEE